MGQIFQTGLVSILSDHRKMPPVILLHLEPEEFIGNQLNDDIQNLKFYYSKNELVTSYLANLSYFEKFKFYFHSYRYNGRVITLVKNYFQTLYKLDEGNGYSPIKRSDRDSVNTLYSIKNISAQIEGRFNLEQWNFFEKFLMICKQNNTKVICFTSPVYKNFNSYPKTMKTIDSLMERHRIQYINYLKYPIEILDEHPGLWRDRQHLNHDGARLESGYLAGAVNEILSLKDSVK